jgi:hypothetical protein
MLSCFGVWNCIEPHCLTILEVNSIDVGSHQKFLSIRFIKSIVAEFVRHLLKTISI